MKVFSFDLSGEFAFFKKNDANDFLYISYNFIHKPVLLGICGAIAGLPGYATAKDNQNPDYYNRLKSLKMAINPHYIKPLKKVITGFNNASGLASKDSSGKGVTWQIREQILVGEPEIRYTVYLLADQLENQSIDAGLMDHLKDRLKKGESEYPLYLGKNEFFAYFDQFQEYEAKPMTAKTAIISSLIRKGEDTKQSTVSFKEVTFDDFDPFDTTINEGHTVYEYLPYDFDENGFYLKDLFVLSQQQLIINNSQGFYTLTPQNGGTPIHVQFI